MTKDLISVIVPVYNTEKYLRRCVDSIKAQTYRALEIILVDDGSTDGSLALCRTLAAEDSRIRVIAKENGGAASARNAGIDAATGEFVGFIDSDDYIDKEMYSRLHKAITDSDSDMAECGYIYEYLDGRIIDGTLTERTVSGAVNCLYVSLSGDNTCFVWNKLFRHHLLDGVRFEPFRLSEDYLIVARISLRMQRRTVVPDMLYHYCENTESVTLGVFGEKNFDALRAAATVADFCTGEFSRCRPLAAGYICGWAIKYYWQAETSDSVKKYRRRLMKIYRSYYRCALSLKNNPILSGGRGFFVRLFALSPRLYAALKRLTDR